MERFYPWIFRRKSFHLFRNLQDFEISDGEIREIIEFYHLLEPLVAGIHTEIRILPSSQVDCRRGQEYCILFYSEKKDNYLANIGWLGQQLDLFLVSKGIGTLWFGIGKPDIPNYIGLDYVIMMAIRKVNDPAKFRKDMFKSKRKSLEEIWQGESLPGVSEIVRFAPSACNTQPWLVRRSSKQLRVYRYQQSSKRGIMPKDRVTYYNRIDMGIFLLFLELCLRHEALPYRRELFTDPGDDREETLNAIYTLE
ncbi:MAG: nitroreductase [Oscillospiraceae bacterium]|nr:nitroreductase [Oscillospiraceae bacterium]